MNTRSVVESAMQQGKGILRLSPTWVPRGFFVLGRRLRLHRDDYFCLGNKRGGIAQRWLASTTGADNGPLTAPNEGLSQVVFEDGEHVERVLLRDAVAELKGGLIGERLWHEHQGWPMYAKFFDNQGPLPVHVHYRDQHAKLVGQRSKPEASYFPAQLNNLEGDSPFLFFGLRPGASKEQVRQCLVNFAKGDNKLTSLMLAYRQELGTGWNVPPGVLHAPGSLCTYEPQRSSDVFAMYQSQVGNMLFSEELLWKSTPPDRIGDYDYLMEALDWELNTDPCVAVSNFMRPKPVRLLSEMEAEGYIENWICFRSPAFSAKELTVLPRRTATVVDRAAYGLILLQGHGKIGVWNVDTPAAIRYGELTSDEFFVSEEAASQGVCIVNPSATEPLVMLKHFGPKNPELA